MDKKEVHNAAVATTAHNEGGFTDLQGKDYLDTIAISVIVNARGRVCMLHNKPFNATPTWVKYLTKQRKVKLLFDNGMEYVIDYVMNDKQNKLFLNIDKLFIIRVEDGNPIDGYDTKIIKE
ncbi:MAG: hypothetical protein K2Q32_00755 [Alphaproteobacteria bacterium]|nr:hypothetical protein [Alphaproteobacteria bacterium]